MTLFAALTAKEGDTSTSTSSSPPEAIQLFANRVINFLTGSTLNLSNDSSTKSNATGEDSNKDGAAAAVASSNSEGKSRHFAALNYQAIQTEQDESSSSSSSSSLSNKYQHLRPDLGVWDCRINSNTVTSSSAMLLKKVVLEKHNHSQRGENMEEEEEEKKGEETETTTTVHQTNNNSERVVTPIVMAVDLADPNEVQPVLEQMRSVVLNIYDTKEPLSSTKSNINNIQACTTTTIKSLEKSIFGRTLIQEEVKGEGTSSSSSSEQRLALILAVIVPSTVTSSKSLSAAEEYKERQARALLLYHLHKFALEVNCTLCFVSETASSSAAGGGGGSAGEKGEDTAAVEKMMAENDPLLGRNTTMSIEEFGKVIRRVAMGLSPVEQSDLLEQSNEEETSDTTKEEGKDDINSRPPSIHVPGSHDAELIHGAYLRNASCEGRWDASKDDLNVALPPHSTNTTKTDETSKEDKAATSGDEEWLSQLASSIGLSPEAATEALSPAPERKDQSSTGTSVKKEKREVKKRPTRSTVTRNKDAKPKDEKEVMNFFDNLLKK